MDHLREFVIPFAGLKPGSHQYEFEIDDRFFDQFEYSEIQKGKLRVRLDMEKDEKMLVLDFRYDGTVDVACDRCLEPFSLPLSGSDRLLVKYGEGYFEENESVQIIPEGDTQLDVSPFIYEFIHLKLPIRRVHPDDANGEPGCDPGVIERLENETGPDEPDPRWDILKGLRDKLK
jgi:uncharacterized protein